jgi:hypothetical protein
VGSDPEALAHRALKANSLCERLIGDTPARVSGLDNPLDRAAPSKNSAVVAPALQSRPTTLFVGARPARPAPEFPSAFATPKASIQPIKPSCGTLRPELTSPRVLPLGPRCMTVVEFLRTTVAAPASADRRGSALGVAVARLEMQARNGPGGRVCVVGRGLPPPPVAWAGLHSWPQRRVAVYPLLEPLDS